MADLVPTRGNAVVFTNGHVIACTKGPIVPTESTIQECLILPAPRPIAECPPEWKDGRDMWLWSTYEKRWIEASYGSIARAWWSETEQFWYDESRATHIMLPPPSPEEATR